MQNLSVLYQNGNSKCFSKQQQWRRLRQKIVRRTGSIYTLRLKVCVEFTGPKIEFCLSYINTGVRFLYFINSYLHMKGLLD